MEPLRIKAIKKLLCKLHISANYNFIKYLSELSSFKKRRFCVCVEQPIDINSCLCDTHIYMYGLTLREILHVFDNSRAGRLSNRTFSGKRKCAISDYNKTNNRLCSNLIEFNTNECECYDCSKEMYLFE